MVYPEQRLIARLLRLRRKVLLPEEALGSVQVQEGQTVDIRDRVARGLIPAQHFILDAQKELRLRKADQLPELMLKQVRARVRKEEVLACRYARYHL